MGKKTDAHLNGIKSELLELVNIHTQFGRALSGYYDAVSGVSTYGKGAQRVLEDGIARFQSGEGTEEEAWEAYRDALKKIDKLNKAIPKLVSRVKQLHAEGDSKVSSLEQKLSSFESFIKDKAKSKKNPFKKLELKVTTARFIKRARKSIAENQVELPGEWSTGREIIFLVRDMEMGM